MKPFRGAGASFSNESFWHEDARERLRVLLPELAISVVAGACLSFIVLFEDGADVPALIGGIGVAQLFVHVLLYTCTYLVRNVQVASWGWMIVIACMYLVGMIASAVTSLDSVFFSPGGPVIISMLMGSLLFYFTRSRWSFAFLAIEVLLLSSAVDAGASVQIAYFVGCGCLVALFVIRTSSTCITMSYEVNEPFSYGVGTAGEVSPTRTNRQIAALGIASGALCLVAVAVGVLPLGLGSNADSAATSSTVEIGQAERPSVGQVGDNPVADGHSGGSAETGSSDSGTDSGGSGGSAGTTRTDEMTATGATAATGESGEEAATAGAAESTGSTGSMGSAGSSGSARPAESADGERNRQEPTATFNFAFVLLALLAIAVLPFAIRLFLRKWTRHSMQREPRETDRVARIYIGVISRLKAAGVMRGEEETPREFLAEHEVELEGLTASAGYGLDEWAALTDAYEKARYGGLSPTGSELETCWKLYDAIPSCTRKKIGLSQYLTSAFWRM